MKRIILMVLLIIICISCGEKHENKTYKTGKSKIYYNKRRVGA